MINVAIIGLGYWGPNYIRIVNESADCRLKWCCDKAEKNLEILGKRDNIRVTTSYKDILEDKDVDAVIIATPTETHYKIAKDCLNAGKHILVEKPLTLKSEESGELIEIADKKRKVLMVGHIFIFNEAVRKLKEYIGSKEIGNVLYLHFSRTGLGPIRKDVNTLWDLATHDLSILLYLIEEKPLNIIARGECYLQKDIEDVVFMTIECENKILANLHVSWLDPYKVRTITVVGDKKMVVFDDISASEPIRLFDKGVSYLERGADYGKFKTLLRDGDIISPKIRGEEPLKREFKEFISSIMEGRKPLTDGKSGYDVVKVAEAAQKSLKNGSVKIKIG